MTLVRNLALGSLAALLATACGSGTADEAPDGLEAPDARAVPNMPPTPDAMPLPDAPPACRYVEVLVDGTFDSSGVWGERADNGLPLIYDAEDMPVPPASPPHSAWLAGYRSGTDRIWQEVSVPANARELYLSAAWCAFTLDPDDAVDDVLAFLIQETGSLDTLEVAHSLANLDADPGEGACTWHSFRKQLDRPYAGQTVRLKIYGTCDSDGPTDFFLDDVSLSALVCD